jgi:hypothetical protein
LPPAAKITSVQVNDGSVQRSRVTSLLVTFDLPPLPAGGLANGFQVKRQSDDAVVSLAAVLSGNTVTLTFSGGPVEFGSLADGRYTLTARATQIGADGLQLDGNGDGTAGDDYVLVGDPTTNKLFRLFGDADGSGTVDALDFGAFLGAFGTANPNFDFDNGGAVDALDFGQFLQRFGTGI